MDQYSLSESQHKTVHHKRIKSGRGWILAVAILHSLAAVGFYFLLKNPTNSMPEELKADAEGGTNYLVITVAAVAVIYWGCWFWAKKQPFPAALVAFLVYITLLIAGAVFDPQQILQGIIFKVLFVIGLGNAVVSAYKLKNSESY